MKITSASAVYHGVQDLALSRFSASCSFCNLSAFLCKQDLETILPPLPMPLGPPNAITMRLCLRSRYESSLWGLWYPHLTACFQGPLFGFDFLKYFLYFNSDPRDLESTPLLFPNKNQTSNKHIAFKTGKLGTPSKDTALGLGWLPVRFPGGNRKSCHSLQAGSLKAALTVRSFSRTRPKACLEGRESV